MLSRMSASSDPDSTSSAAPATTDERRSLGSSGIEISPIALGTWPIAGVTTSGVTDRDSVATIQAALDSGINFFDAAYCYGPNGESERLIGQSLVGRRDEAVLATKGGIHYDRSGKQAQDARPQTLLAECDESLRRLGVDRVELYYLHSPDPEVPIEDSAGAVARMIEAGKVRSAGASNCQLEQLQAFDRVCPLTAVQLPYNMLQRGIERRTIPWCLERGIAIAVYWPLMKGLLAGGLPRTGKLQAGDRRLDYPMFQGEQWRRNQQFVEALRAIADQCGRTVSQLVLNWTMTQVGVTAALCGAKRPWQIEENAGAMGWRLSQPQLEAIQRAIDARGEAVVKRIFS